MIMVLNRNNDPVWINHEHIARIEPSPRLRSEYRIYTIDGKMFDSNTDIKVILDLIKKARGEQ